MTSFGMFAIAFFTGAFLLPIAIGYFSSTRTRAIVWAVLVMVLGQAYDTVRMWWFNIPDPLGRMPNDPALQVEIVQVTVMASFVYAWLAIFGFWIRKKTAKERA